MTDELPTWLKSAPQVGEVWLACEPPQDESRHDERQFYVVVVDDIEEFDSTLDDYDCILLGNEDGEDDVIYLELPNFVAQLPVNRKYISWDVKSRDD